MIKIEKYREVLNNKIVQRTLLKQQKKQKNSNLFLLKKELDVLLDSQILVQEVAKKTQKEIRIYISDIVNLAIDSIPFEDRLEYFDIEFEIKRNQIEGAIFYVKNDKKMNPLLSSGGGLLDITSFGLQVACWSLQTGKKNNTIILDENFKFVSSNLRGCVGEMLKKVSEKLGLQIIFVTHNTEYLSVADKVFEISKKDKISNVEIIK